MNALNAGLMKLTGAVLYIGPRIYLFVTIIQSVWTSSVHMSHSAMR